MWTKQETNLFLNRLLLLPLITDHFPHAGSCCGAHQAGLTAMKLGLCKMPHKHAATLNQPVENTPFDVSLIRKALINRSPSAEAAEHLPTIQLCDPRAAGSRPTLCCEKSLLTPSIKGTLILCLTRPTAWNAAPGLITSGRARRRRPQRGEQPYQLSHSVTYHTFIPHQGAQAPQACPLWLMHRTYAGGEGLADE